MIESFRRTKIVATLGPASSDHIILRGMIDAGVDVFRLNFSHGSHAQMGALIRNIRSVSKDSGKPVAILQDLQGPKIRVGPLPVNEMHLERGQRLRVYGDSRMADETGFSITYEQLAKDIHAGALIFIDDGLIELRVSRVMPDAVDAEVVIGGRMRARQGVNLPGVHLNTPCLTEKDEVDLNFGLQAGVDLVALSFVRKATDVLPVRETFRRFDVSPPLIAKIERREALDEIEAVVEAFDAVMVARGDLGVDLRVEKVPAAQKQIIKHALEQGKPVITATQMLESMTTNSMPTRAEASDVANAVYDGTDAVMLSGETAVGAHPILTVKTMDRIVREAEAQPFGPIAAPRFAPSSMVSFCTAAVNLAADLHASALAALTRTGENAQVLAALRPDLPIFALCENPRLVYNLAIRCAVQPIAIEHSPDIDEASEIIRGELARLALVPPGSPVVVVGVGPGSKTGKTDFIRAITI